MSILRSIPVTTFKKTKRVIPSHIKRPEWLGVENPIFQVEKISKISKEELIV